MKPDWKPIATDIHLRYIEQARLTGSLLSKSEITHYLALALCGEAGEFANLIKKMWQGEQVPHECLRDEIADIRIYLEHIAHYLHVDLDEACHRKLAEVANRIATRERTTGTGPSV